MRHLLYPIEDHYTMQPQNGNNLIFLISQPRAGSTLLQRIIGAHPDVHTGSEPWVMLHPLFARRKTGVETVYSHDLATRALDDFIASLPGKEGEYIEALRTMYGSLYETILQSTGKKRFLDKTPRYYFILKELHELFPEARFIILFRNPLAVLASIMKTWAGTDWHRLAHHRHDLLDAPDLLLSGVQYLKEKSHIVRYEELVKNPETIIRELCDFLSLSFNSDMIHYNQTARERWRYGDQQTIYDKDRPDPSYADKWIDSTTEPEAWTILKEYLEYLGEKRMGDLGYSYTGSMELMKSHKQPRGAGGGREKRIGSKTVPDRIADPAGPWREIILDKDEQITKLKDQIKGKDDFISQVEGALSLKIKEMRQLYITNTRLEKVLNDKNEEIEQLRMHMNNKDNYIQRILNSYTYRLGNIISKPIKIIKFLIGK